jgi:Rrf2 family protein
MELAREQASDPVSLGELASRQNISHKYLEAIFGMLQKHGIVRSRRGPAGGYMLAKEPADITLLEILNAVEGPPAVVDCLSHESACDASETCPSRTVWKNLEEHITGFLAEQTLDKMLA